MRRFILTAAAFTIVLLALTQLPTGHAFQATPATTSAYLAAVFKAPSTLSPTVTPLPSATPTSTPIEDVHVIQQRMYFDTSDQTQLDIIGILVNATQQPVYNVHATPTCFDANGNEVPFKDSTGGAFLVRIDPGVTSPYGLSIHEDLTPLTAIQRCSLTFTWDTQSAFFIETLTVLSYTVADTSAGVEVQGDLDPAGTQASTTIVSVFDAQGQLLGIAGQNLLISKYPPHGVPTHFDIPVTLRFGNAVATTVVQSEGRESSPPPCGCPE